MDSRLSAQVALLEADVSELRKERNEFRDDLSRSRARIAELQSLLDAKDTKINDLKRRLKFIEAKVNPFHPVYRVY